MTATDRLPPGAIRPFRRAYRPETVNVDGFWIDLDWNGRCKKCGDRPNALIKGHPCLCQAEKPSGR